jgi:type II secretory pathway component GspD/PulD (secretin)
MAMRLKSIFAILNLFPLLISCTLAAESLADQLVTRTYKLNSAKIQKLQDVILDQPSSDLSASDLLRILLQKEGIEISPKPKSLSEPFGKDFYFNERTGELILRASRRDIPKFEKYLSQISLDPPRVSIETTVLELSDTSMPEQIRSALTNLNSLTGFTNLQVLTANQFRTILETLPTNSFSFSAPSTSNVVTFSGRNIRIIGDHDFFPYKSSAPVISVPAGDMSLLIRADFDQ